MKPLTYYKSLSTEERKEYADRAGTTIRHFHSIFREKGGFKKRPRDELLIRLSLESEGHVSLDEAIDYFLTQPVKNLAKEMEVKEQAPRTSSAPSKRTNVQQMELAGT